MSTQMPARILQSHLLAAPFTRRLILHAYDLVHLWLTVSALNGGPATATLDCKVQYTDPINNDGVTGEWLDIPDAAFNRLTELSVLPHSQVLTLEDVDLASPYLQVVLTPAFVGGAAPSFTTTLTYVAKRR